MLFDEVLVDMKFPIFIAILNCLVFVSSEPEAEPQIISPIAGRRILGAYQNFDYEGYPAFPVYGNHIHPGHLDHRRILIGPGYFGGHSHPIPFGDFPVGHHGSSHHEIHVTHYGVVAQGGHRRFAIHPGGPRAPEFSHHGLGGHNVLNDGLGHHDHGVRYHNSTFLRPAYTVIALENTRNSERGRRRNSYDNGHGHDHKYHDDR